MKTVLITGGGRGIGKAAAIRLARDGFHVCINYRSNHDEARTALDHITTAGGSAQLCPFDITDAHQTQEALALLTSQHMFDALIFCAGIHSDALLVFMEERQWRDVLDTNLYSFYHVVRPVIKQMLLRRSGHIVVVSSTSAESGVPGQVNYSAAKAGLIGATKSLALECARRGVLVNAVTPGYIETEMTATLDRELVSRVPLGRFGTPEEVAGVISFLVSADASYLTGQVIRVNGGVYL